MNIRYTAAVTIINAVRALVEEHMPSGTCVVSNGETPAVITLDVSRDDVTCYGDREAIRRLIEDNCPDISVRRVNVLEARCDCGSSAPHRCECVTADGWTDDQEVA